MRHFSIADLVRTNHTFLGRLENGPMSSSFADSSIPARRRSGSSIDTGMANVPVGTREKYADKTDAKPGRDIT
jgi:hypothetical protein